MTSNKWSRELLYDLHYNQNLSLKEICEKFKMTDMGLRSTMRYHKVPIRHVKNKWTYEKLYDLYYTQRLSTGEIAKQFGVDYITIQSQLTYYGIPLRGVTEAAQLRDGQDRYNENFLDAWSPSLAWFLGIMYTDGSITKNLREANFSVNDKDLSEQVAILLGPGVTVRPIRKMWRVGIYRKDLVAKLLPYGLHPNKTHTLSFPEVPEKFLPDFVRGVWDGDGSITLNNRNYPCALFGCASERFVISLVDIIQKNTGLPFPKIYSEKGYRFWRFAYGGDGAKVFLNWIYSNSIPELRLNRKYQRYLKGLTWARRRSANSIST